MDTINKNILKNCPSEVRHSSSPSPCYSRSLLHSVLSSDSVNMGRPKKVVQDEDTDSGSGGRPKKAVQEDELSEDGKIILAAMREEWSKQKIKFSDMIDVKNAAIELLQSEVTSLKGRVAKLEDKIDDSDAYERRDTVLFSGEGLPAGSPTENLPAIICGLVKEKLKFSIAPGDISTAHRLGKKPLTQQPDRRKIVVKFCRRDVKKDILFASRQLKPNFYVNESLTPVRNTIMFTLRKIRREHEDTVRGSSSTDGRVFVWVPPPVGAPPAARNAKLPINSLAQLEEFTKKFLDKTVDAFINPWPH